MSRSVEKTLKHTAFKLAFKQSHFQNARRSDCLTILKKGLHEISSCKESRQHRGCYSGRYHIFLPSTKFSCPVPNNAPPVPNNAPQYQITLPSTESDTKKMKKQQLCLMYHKVFFPAPWFWVVQGGCRTATRSFPSGSRGPLRDPRQQLLVNVVIWGFCGADD